MGPEQGFAGGVQSDYACVQGDSHADGMHDPFFCTTHQKHWYKGGACPGEAKRVYVDKSESATKASNPKDSIGDTKVPLWLLSPIAKAHWALGQYAGMLKYGAWNWRKAGVRTSVYLSAMERHLEAYKSGEQHDPVDGSHHLGNIMACCAILLDADAAGMLTDDRPPSVGIRDTFKFVEHVMAKLKHQYADKNPKHYTIKDN